jgi:hypothetical protein
VISKQLIVDVFRVYAKGYVKNLKGTREHRGKGPKDDEKESGTICSANISMGREVEC